MPVTVIPDNGFFSNLGQTLLRSMVQQQQLDLQERAQALREQQFKMEQEQMEAQAQGAQAALGAFLSQGPQAQQMAAQAFPQAAQPAQAFTPNLTPGQAQPVPERVNPQAVPGASAAGFLETAQPILERTQQTENIQDALGIINKEAQRLGDPAIAKRAEAALELSLAGVDASIITDILPPSMKEMVDLQSAKLNIQGMEDERSADVFATAWLQRQGVVPEGAPIIPGASNTLLKVVESREGESINWLQEGLDFVSSRVGDSASGSSFPFTVDPTTGNLVPSSGEAVGVDDAISEWKAIVTSYAPPEQRDEILEKIDSNLFQRRLRVSQATNIAADVFAGAEDATSATQDVREILEEDGGFTDSEIQSIIRTARQRASRPRR